MLLNCCCMETVALKMQEKLSVAAADYNSDLVVAAAAADKVN